MHIPDKLKDVLQAIRLAGGSPHLVGGTVRDHLMGNKPKDFDVETSFLTLPQLKAVLEKFGQVDLVGKQFGVFKIHNFEVDADFSLPRRENKKGVGHKDFEIEIVPDLSLEERCRRRDLSVNSIEFDPFENKFNDPFNGIGDLKSKVFRATDARTFVEDPLRPVRVAQFISRFPQMTIDTSLTALCSTMDLSPLPGERIWEEFRKMLLKGSRPDLGLEFLKESELLRFFPELQIMIGCQQHPVFHAEGDVFTHTQMAVRVASTFRSGNENEDLYLMFGVLCHDMGKPCTTVYDPEKKRWTSLAHDEKGVEPAEKFLRQLVAPEHVIDVVKVLVREHLKPFELIKNNSTPSAYRRLARRMKGTSFELLVKVANADNEGRLCYDPVHQTREDMDEFLRRAKDAGVIINTPTPITDIVLGRHLLARGFQPGKHVGDILRKCREVQDELGWTDADKILDKVLDEAGRT